MCSFDGDGWSEGDKRKARQGTKHEIIARDLASATSLLKRHWPAVHALARRLMEVQVIDGVEAEQIITDALDANTRLRLQRAA